MEKNLQLNADRFLGFVDTYDGARPKCPEKVKEIVLNYMEQFITPRAGGVIE